MVIAIWGPCPRRGPASTLVKKVEVAAAESPSLDTSGTAGTPSPAR